MSDSKQPGSDPAATRIDWLLGELTEEESRDLQRGCVQNPDFAKDTAELQSLFDDLRSLQPEPQSGDSRVALALRATIERRLGLRRPSPSVLSQVVFVRSLKVAAVAAVCLGAFLLGERWWVDAGIWAGNTSVVVAQAPRPVRETVNSLLPIEDASREERSATAWLI